MSKLQVTCDFTVETHQRWSRPPNNERQELSLSLNISPDSKSSDTKKHKKEQKCGRCKIHGDNNVPLRGHKIFCKYRNCNCTKCHHFLRKQKSSAGKIAEIRRRKLIAENKEKGEKLPQKVPPTSVSSNNEKRCHLHILLDHAYSEMCRAWWYYPRMKYILEILKYYANFFDDGVKIDSFLEDAKKYMSQVVHGSVSLQYPVCCYLAVGALKEEQLVEIRPHYSFQNLPNLTPKFQPISTSKSLFSDILFNVSTEPSTKPSIKPVIDPSTESSTDPTDFATHYW